MMALLLRLLTSFHHFGNFCAHWKGLVDGVDECEDEESYEGEECDELVTVSY